MRFALFVIVSLLMFLACNPTQKQEPKTIKENTDSEVVLANNLDFAPNFVLKDIDDNLVKLADFKGSYVYMDIWATWCGPCKIQIPALKELEEKYHNTDLKFVSISVDAEKDKQKWFNFVQNQQLTGYQLYAGKKTPFSADYEVSTIPKFVLLGKEGEILDGDAPRPLNHYTGGVNEDLVQIFDELLKAEKT